MSGIMSFRRFLVSVLCLAFAACASHHVPEYCPDAPDYASASMWYRPADSASLDSKPADVFYVLPTCVWSWKTSDGQECFYMDVHDSAQRALVEGSNLLASALFGASCNFYSPYYRQITMDSWFEPEEEINRRYALAHQDVVAAFRYYMEHFNGGKPFFLAGHSQGGKAVIELLKHTLTDAERERLVAAYVFGYSVSEAELAEFPALEPAQAADDCGVVICYNSVSHPEACSELFKDNVVCINPVNWRTDSVYAPSSRHAGAVFFDAQGRADTLFHAFGVKVRPDLHTLLIDGLKDEDYFIPSVSKTLFLLPAIVQPPALGGVCPQGGLCRLPPPPPGVPAGLSLRVCKRTGFLCLCPGILCSFQGGPERGKKGKKCTFARPAGSCVKIRFS